MNGARSRDLEETMEFDPEEGIANLDEHLDRLKHAAEAQGFKFDRHAARNELQAATFGKRRRGDRAAAAVADRRDGDRGEGVGLGRQRKAQQPVRHRHQRRRIAADRAHDLGMMRVEPAGQRAERRHDQLASPTATKQRRDTLRPFR